MTDAATASLGSDDGRYERFNPGDHAGQLRMAHCMADYYGDRLIHVNGIGWHFWDGRRWDKDVTGNANRIAQATLKRAASEAFDFPDPADTKRLLADVNKCHGTASGITGMLKQAEAERRFAVTADALDADPYLLNVANGTLDLHSGKVKPFDPADRITKVCRAGYRPDDPRDGQLWEAVLKRVLPDEAVRDYFRRVVGMSLIGEPRDHILPILNGDGRNGKTTVVEAILYALGDYASLAEPELLLHRDGAHPTGQMDLIGRRFVAMSEIPKGSRMNEVLMKRLTADRVLKARYMHKDLVEFNASHTAVMVTNDLPKMSGDDLAAWERVRVIPFDVYIPEAERDVELGAKLQLEADGILTWAVAGVRDYLDGGLRTPEGVLVRTNKYRLDNDELGRFIGECCTTGPDANGTEATTRELHARFGSWRARQSGGVSMHVGEREFGRMLDQRGHTTMPPIKGRRPRNGIALKPESGGRE
ncbi:DNA primase family protein [Mycolicibacterium holsaticum]|uniref:DNA primase family protein n=1 Tax=Mycolicibacterium holsaticum TaxID=152142 RepID=UPI001C7D1EF8|nr:phage/plasmid primase, P4 family [Mycolicibacterium holsaticum]MDA4105705.1 hypothetical protein [Mycolicibacterium holsaticum DSM 44478 = JCM 12374]QZA13924.1 hypothetical protein K3U96_07305 [Mycolicibacterium holsaticum DSM 44478 = JCM 12374]UNC08616.1 hypothetical protein H5U41_19525 [Mycolicibacterium holsaticum DSM 44478 = JCM 12374]